jgi:ABC-type Co2+ transport system permease subunit
MDYILGGIGALIGGGLAAVVFGFKAALPAALIVGFFCWALGSENPKILEKVRTLWRPPRD